MHLVRRSGIIVGSLVGIGEIEMEEKVEINGVEYVRAGTRPTGNRAVVVVDRGWIFAGDVTRKNGRIYLRRAVWVFKWEQVGFDGMVADPASEKVTIRPMPNGVDIPEGAEIFSVPVDDSWGL